MIGQRLGIWNSFSTNTQTMIYATSLSLLDANTALNNLLPTSGEALDNYLLDGTMSDEARAYCDVIATQMPALISLIIEATLPIIVLEIREQCALGDLPKKFIRKALVYGLFTGSVLSADRIRMRNAVTNFATELLSELS